MHVTDASVYSGVTREGGVKDVGHKGSAPGGETLLN